MENTIKEWLRYAKDRDGGGRNGKRRKEGGGGDWEGEEETYEKDQMGSGSA